MPSISDTVYCNMQEHTLVGSYSYTGPKGQHSYNSREVKCVTQWNKKSSKLFPCRLQIYDDFLSYFFLLQASLLASFLRIDTRNSRCVEFDFAFFFIYRSWQSLFWCAEVNICSDDSTDSLNETKHAHQLDKLLKSLLSDTSVWFKSPPPFPLKLFRRRVADACIRTKYGES